MKIARVDEFVWSHGIYQTGEGSQRHGVYNKPFGASKAALSRH